jgi:hypothetical protein
VANVTRADLQGKSFSGTWLLTQADSTGDGLSHLGAADRTIQVLGTFDGATVTIEGSNVAEPAADAEWAVLHDTADQAMQFATAQIALIAENPRWIRPKLTGAGAATEITVIAVARSGR